MKSHRAVADRKSALIVSTTGRYPALDGIRGIAVILVVCSHATVPWLKPGGSTGVTLFFVLSGFLITRLLLIELRDTRRINIGSFFIRRARRLLPALVLMLTCLTLACAALRPDYLAQLVPVALGALIYIANWTLIGNGWATPISHLWSLSVEEQFYLTWPFLMLMLVRWARRWILVVLGGGIVVSLTLRYRWLDSGNFHTYLRGYVGTDTNAYALLLGAAVASICMLYRRSPRVRRPVLVGTITSAILVLTLEPVVDLSPVRVEGGLAPLVAVLSAILILIALPGNKILETRSLRYFGKISYGLYLWHAPLLWATQVYFPSSPFAMLVAVLLSIGISAVSFKYFESRLLARSRGTSEQLQPLDESV